MIVSIENICHGNDLTNSNVHLTGSLSRKTWREKTKGVLKNIKYLFRETTVEPCLFVYMMCTAISSLAVQNMHLEKACRVNLKFGDEICDRIRDRNTTGLDEEVTHVQSLVAKVVAWKFPLQTAIPAVMVIFVGAWSDKYKKRKICILFPFIGEVLSNIGLLIATYYFNELSLTATALIEALPAAFTGSYIIIFLGMYSFMADRTTVENRTFRLGLVAMCVTLGTPTGTGLSGILLRALGYYGVFTLLLGLYLFSFIYGLFRLEDIIPNEEHTTKNVVMQSKCKRITSEVIHLVGNTVMVALKPRAFGGRTQIFCVLLLYLLMVGPLYGSLTRKTLREKIKNVRKNIKYLFRETTVEPCLFMYMMCTSISSLAMQNMHLEKACRVNLQFGDEICDRIRDRNTTGLDEKINHVQSLVAKVVAWKFALQTTIPAVMVIFVGAWSDKYKKRKICILFPFIGEVLSNIGLLIATYYFNELSLTATALIEALPAAFTGSYIIIFLGVYSFMADRTTVENRTFRLGLVTMCVTLGTPTGTGLSGILLRDLGYYGVFTLLLGFYLFSFIYGLFRLEDIISNEEPTTENVVMQNKCKRMTSEVIYLVGNTVMVALKPRAFGGRTQIFCVLLLYLLMVGPLYGDSQVSYLYTIRKFNFTEVEYSVYSTINIVLGLFGTVFCISVLSKRLNVQDSAIGALAGASRIAGSIMFATSPNRTWFYSAPVFNIFSHTGLTAVRSIATKSVPTEEIAKLSALIGVTEALAPSIYMPASSYIYMMTMDTFPGAFYMFDAALTIFALTLFALIYIMVRRRNKQTVTKQNIKDEFARSNEISKF